MVEAITFDVGGTLIQPWPSVGEVYRDVAARHGHRNIDAEILNRQFAGAWRVKEGFDHSRTAWRELVEASFAGLVEAGAVAGFFDPLYDRFAAPEAWRVFDEVEPTLQSLRRGGMRLGIISNWDERLRPLLTSLRLSDYFEMIVVSVEAGVPKPARAIFDQASRLLGLKPGSILHVGDSVEEDVAGARSAGLQAVLLDRKRKSGDSSAIATLAGLRDLVKAAD